MDQQLQQLVERVKTQLQTQYGSKIVRVLVYGSHARGTARPDSDVDILIIVDDTLDPVEVRDRIQDLLLDILLETQELLSTIVVPQTCFENANTAFMLNVRREGVMI